MNARYSTINIGGVNCYLIQIDTHYILIDNGFAAKSRLLDKELNKSGCKPGNLLLVVLTHGDYDHVGNSVFLRNKYGAKIAMHADDSMMVTKGDPEWNRKNKPDKFTFMFRTLSFISSLLFNPDALETFTPDMYIDEDFDFSPYKLNAKVIHTPGHSKGSISILTGDGYLFCGDLLYNFLGRPRPEYCDNARDFKASIEKLKPLPIKKIYPGHGKPFTMEHVENN